MSEERVDKAWHKQGLSKYSVGAILGTLRHYGVQVDEPAFKALSAEKYPLQIAELWLPSWKGTGQFSRFPIFAADELWTRVNAERLSPISYAQALMELLGELSRLLGGAPDAKVGAGFKKVGELRSRVPLKEDKADRSFVSEVVARLGEQGMKFFQSMSAQLSQQGHQDDAEEFAELETFLFPQMAGISQEMVRAAKGGQDREEALAALSAVGRDTTRDFISRLTALDALIHVEAFEPSTALARELYDTAEQAKDFHVAMDIGQRLVWLLDKAGNHVEKRQAEQRLRKLTDEHAVAHRH